MGSLRGGRPVDVGAEAVLIAGGGRAILLQLANPAVGYAVADHSNFVSNPMRRLVHTLTYTYALVYGSAEMVRTVQAMVNRAHAPVHSDGTPPPQPEPAVECPHATADAATPPSARTAYDANDATLQVWVTATLYQTAITLRQRLMGALPDEALDRIYQEYAIVGTTLKVPQGMWPADRAEFAEYWAKGLSELQVDDRIRSIAHDLLNPKPTAPLWMRSVMPLARLVTTGLLPVEIRELYQFPWDAKRERNYERALDVMAGANRLLPKRVRQWPKDRLMKDLQKHITARSKIATAVPPPSTTVTQDASQTGELHTVQIIRHPRPSRISRDDRPRRVSREDRRSAA